jgi:protein O-mannosyl-transferase
VLAARCVWFYLGRLGWPDPLVFVYPRWTVDTAGAAAWLPVAALACLPVALWGLRRRGGGPALLALAWFVANLLPVLNFFRMYYARYTFVADHWQYLASMGAIAWVVGTGVWLTRRLARRRGLIVEILAGAVLLGLLSGLTWRQTHDYHDSESLWLDVLSHNPTAAIAYNNLGTYYAQHGDPAMAETTLRRGLEYHPGDAELETILAGLLIGQKRWNEALGWLDDALKQMPDDPEILNNLGLVHAGLGQVDQAVKDYRAALRRDPNYAEIYNNLVKTLLDAGRRDEARFEVEEGLRHLPDEPLLLRLRAIVQPPPPGGR